MLQDEYSFDFINTPCTDEGCNKSVANVSGHDSPLHIHDNEWNTILDIINILKPFQVATDVIQRNHASLIDVYLTFHNILITASMRHYTIQLTQ